MQKLTAGWLDTPQGRIRLLPLATNILRVTHVPPGVMDFPADRPWMEHVFLPRPGFPPEKAELFASWEHDRLEFRNRPDGFALALADGPRWHGPNFVFSFQIEPGEGFYGWGEWFDAFRRQRGRWRLHIQESPSLLQSRRTYSALPYFLSSRGYGCLLLNSHTSEWHLQPRRQQLTIQATGPAVDYLLFYGPDFKRILEAYTGLTGRPPLLPRWAFGLWATSYPQGTQSQVLEHVRQHRRQSIPLDAVILDYHWEARFHNFQWRPALIPDPDGLIADLAQSGVRLGLILTPFVNDRNLLLQKLVLQTLVKDIPDGMVFADDRALPEYQQARYLGLLAHPRAKWWFGGGGMLDFSNPQATQWWNARLRPLYDQGVAFFKNDDGEYLPANAVSALGMSGAEYHNLYGFFYGRAMYTGMQALDQRRPLIYARSVWVGSQRYPAMFLGDQKPSFACIRRTLRAGLNLGLAGFAYWTADVFGLDGKTTPETHMRYAQWALLAPVARYFWRPPHIDGTRFPWSHGPAAEANFRRYTELRYRLLPYYVSLAWEAYQHGLPLLRPLIIEFPRDERLASIADQVMLGDRLMLCPVVQQGAQRRKIVLPAGPWHDFWSLATWQGPGEIDYPAPLDRLPLLVRGGTLLLMGPPLDHIRDDQRFDRLELHLWPPYPALGDLYDEDGCTRAYQAGAYSVTRLEAQPFNDILTVRVGPAKGHFPEQPVERRWTFVFHRFSLPKQVRVNGRMSADWQFDSPRQELRLTTGFTTAKGGEIEIALGGDDGRRA